MGDPSPRVVLIQNVGLIAIGPNVKRAKISRDLYHWAIEVMAGADGLSDFVSLTAEESFAEVAVSGANFATAETGTVCVVESEGNGRMCTTLPKTLITVMGIEKVLPRVSDLEVMFQLLPRSSPPSG
jgi:L-lactate utilization protein LutC